MTTHRYVALLGLSALLLLTGCQSGQNEMGYDSAGGDWAVESLAVEDGVREQMAVAPAEPSVITTGYLTMSAEAPAATADDISRLVTDAGGRVSSRSDYTPVDFGQPSSYLEVRIPSDEFESIVESITELGSVQEISVNTQDVSLQKIDLDARIQVLDVAIERLASLLAEAETTTDIVTIESALTERQAERDSLQSQRDYLGDQTLFATLSINVITPADATPADPDGFSDGLERGWLAILAFFAGAIVWAGILVPWIGLAAVLVATIWLVRKLVSSRRNRP